LEERVGFLDERNRTKSREDSSGPMERLCRGFTIVKCDEAASEAKIRLPLLQHEAEVGGQGPVR
jgi:hypothetical protein